MSQPSTNRLAAKEASANNSPCAKARSHLQHEWDHWIIPVIGFCCIRMSTPQRGRIQRESIKVNRHEEADVAAFLE